MANEEAALVIACGKLVGREFDLELSDCKGMRGKFVVQKSWIDMLHFYAPVKYDGQLWHQVADIPWGQGFHTVLYYNGDARLIAVHNELCLTSEIMKEYELY